MAKKSNLKHIPKNEVAEVKKIAGETAASTARATAAQVVAEYHGPIPPASEFKRYEDALPGAADRILGMSEQALKAEVRSNYMDRIGVFIHLLLDRGFLYFLVIVAMILVLNGHEVAAIFAALAPIISSVYSSFRRKDNNNE